MLPSSGWFIQYIDREEEERRERLAKKEKVDKDDEERMAELIAEQARRYRQRYSLQSS